MPPQTQAPPAAPWLSRSLASASPAQIAKALESLTEAQAQALAKDWSLWARPDQLAPPGRWRFWLDLRGRGAGKTRTGAEWVRGRVEAGLARRIALIGETAADAREVMVEGESGILRVCPDWDRPRYEPSKRRLTWRNGAIATTYSADDPEQLRGPVHDCVAFGAMISTPHGQVQVEALATGDLVSTRYGVGRVIEARAHHAPTGEIVCTNGRSLRCTREHPLLTADRGWIAAGSIVLADALCGGLCIRTDTSSQESAGARSTNIATFTSGPLVQYRMGGSSITSTGANETTQCATWPRCRKSDTGDCTCSREERLSALGVDARSSDREAWETQCAGNAIGLKQTTAGEPSGLAANAALCSCRSLGFSVASVASIWVEDGQGMVCNLHVEPGNEYVANGMVVHNCVWWDEAAKGLYPDDVYSNADLGLRSGDLPQMLLSTTPRPIPFIRDLVLQSKQRPDVVVVTRGSTYANAANLPRAFLEQLRRRYDGTRLGRQEIYGEILDDVPGALWTRAVIEATRQRTRPDLERVVVAIDPAVTSGEDSDETGIVVAGKGVDGRAYVLEDLTCRLSPDGWARRAVDAYDRHNADRIVAEVNNGGDLVERVIRTADINVSYRAVRASRGKRTRAEPVAALYEQGRVTHVGMFAELEDQMASFAPGFVSSPDRVDALVWALSDLMLTEDVAFAF